MTDPIQPAGGRAGGTIERNLNAAAGIQYRNEYLQLSKTLTYSYLFALPLVLLYEIGLWLIDIVDTSSVRIGADVLIKRALEPIGLNGTLVLSVLLVIVGVVIVARERKQGVVLKGRYFLLMLIESLFYAVTVGMFVSTLVNQLFGLAIPPLQIGGSTGVIEGLVLSLGAGFYEELLFRLILVTVLYKLLQLTPIGDRWRYAIAMIIGALIFSWVHYIGSLAYEFTLSSFVFRALMGLALNGLFILRGFGVAAMTHALFDVIVTLMQA